MKNLQILIGNLGQDPETHTFNDGQKLTRFSVATSESWNDKATGEKKTETTWHNCVTNNKLAEISEKYLKKGSKVFIEGKTKHRSYEQDGIKKYTTEVIVKELKFLDTLQQ
jgi:single-strand DNA-binding protein